MEQKTRTLPTVADLLALKGKRQLTMLKFFSLDEAAAAEAAGIDIASVPAVYYFIQSTDRSLQQFFQWQGKPIRNVDRRPSI